MHASSNVHFFSFFFSSRRRHTRWPRDWSSDVCSSDLVDDAGGAQHRPHQLARHLCAREQVRRSEERRVGKEWRFLWGPHLLEKDIELRMGYLTELGCCGLVDSGV